MKFKYHKSYRGFYLLEDNKFKRPFLKLDQDKTLEKAGEIDFSKDKIIDISDEFVVFVDKKQGEVKKTSEKKSIRKVVNNDLNIQSLELRYQIPAGVLEHMYKLISENSSNPEKHFMSILSVIQNITLTDGLFFSKVRKIFYYNHDELSLTLNRYNMNNIKIDSLKKDVEVDYPSQYISDLPIDYKEYEMIFVFYFIVLIELLAVLK